MTNLPLKKRYSCWSIFLKDPDNYGKVYLPDAEHPGHQTEAGRTAEEPLNVKSYEPQSRQVLALWLFLVYNIATGEVR